MLSRYETSNKKVICECLEILECHSIGIAPIPLKEIARGSSGCGMSVINCMFFFPAVTLDCLSSDPTSAGKLHLLQFTLPHPPSNALQLLMRMVLNDGSPGKLFMKNAIQMTQVEKRSCSVKLVCHMIQGEQMELVFRV